MAFFFKIKNYFFLILKNLLLMTAITNIRCFQRPYVIVFPKLSLGTCWFYSVFLIFLQHFLVRECSKKLFMVLRWNLFRNCRCAEIMPFCRNTLMCMYIHWIFCYTKMIIFVLSLTFCFFSEIVWDLYDR